MTDVRWTVRVVEGEGGCGIGLFIVFDHGQTSVSRPGLLNAQS